MKVEFEAPDGASLGFSLTGGSPSTIHVLVPGGTAANAGATAVSALLCINDADVSGKSCHTCAQMLAAAARPVTLKFRVAPASDTLATPKTDAVSQI